MHGAIDDDRRRFLSIAAAVIAGAGRCPDHRKRPDAGVRLTERFVPYLRGYGTTRFLSPDTFRNGQQAALAADIVVLMDVLAIDKAIRRASPPADPLHGLKPIST